MSLIIQDLSASTTLEQAVMTTVRGGILVEPISVLPFFPPGLPPCIARELPGLFPDQGFETGGGVLM